MPETRTGSDLDVTFMYCYNLYSLLRPVNNLSLRGEGRERSGGLFWQGDESGSVVGNRV